MSVITFLIHICTWTLIFSQGPPNGRTNSNSNSNPNTIINSDPNNQVTNSIQFDFGPQKDLGTTTTMTIFQQMQKLDRDIAKIDAEIKNCETQQTKISAQITQHKGIGNKKETFKDGIINDLKEYQKVLDDEATMDTNVYEGQLKTLISKHKPLYTNLGLSFPNSYGTSFRFFNSQRTMNYVNQNWMVIAQKIQDNINHFTKTIRCIK